MLFESKKRLFLLDGMALTYRAHYALIRSPRFTSAGLCTSAVFGIANTLFDILKKQKPTHIAVAFDTPGEPTFRHEQFEEYKATRDAAPEDLTEQFPYVYRFFEAMNIPIIRAPGFEADDIIGTLAKEAEENDFATWMVTPDKDYQQLVTEKSLVYKPGRKGSEFEILGEDEVLNKWQIERVEQVIDILGLMGDSSDNIPGIPGVGEKTAQKLVKQFGSVEKLLQSTDQLKGKQKERVEENRDQALLSKELVTIKCDVPLDITPDALPAKEYDESALKTLFEELEFDHLGKKLFGKDFSSAKKRTEVIREKREKEIQTMLFDEPVEQEKTIADVKHDYKVVKTKEERAALIEQLKQQKQFCFDTETTGRDPRHALPLGVAFSFKPHTGYYVVCPPDAEEAKQVLEEFRTVFEDASIEKVGHNVKYDVTLLKWHLDMEVRGTLMDTMLAHSMKEPEMQKGLDYLSKLYLAYKPIPTSELIGEDGSTNMREVPVEKVAEYACEDADVTLQVSSVIRDDIEQRGVAQVCYDIECPLVAVLVEMEHAGIRLDTEALHKYSDHLAAEIVDLRDEIFKQAGHEFNIDSPKQLGVVIYDELEIEKNPKKTATGQYSTREPELLRLAGKHKIIRDVLDYRNAVKLKSVYVDQLPNDVNPNTGRLHTHYSQSWTATGRMQSGSPNLQTIPVRKERGREIRAAFVPRDDDHLLLAADYSQIELRVMAELSGDKAMMDAFVSGTDIHAMTAAQAYKVELDEVTREMRDKAKTVNFGIIYGISAFGLQQRLNIPRKEATALIDNYFEKYPGVQEYIDKSIAFAQEHGYVKTQSGRRRYIRDINSRSRTARNAAERLAMNSPIQGTAADMLKLAMIKVHHALKEGDFKTKMLLTVHDELVFDLHKSEQDEVMPLIEQCMKNALPMKVPIEVELGTGKNWLEAH